jgi:hypothetical protein
MKILATFFGTARNLACLDLGYLIGLRIEQYQKFRSSIRVVLPHDLLNLTDRIIMVSGTSSQVARLNSKRTIPLSTVTTVCWQGMTPLMQWGQCILRGCGEV